MIRKLENLLGEKGSMMVEALAMLGLISMVTPVLYKKAAERTTELQDINAAAQIRTLSKALDDVIKDNYDTLGNPEDVRDRVETLASLGLENEFRAYLPDGFNLEQSKLFNEYQFRIIRKSSSNDPRNNHVSLTGLVVAPSLEGNTGRNFNTRASKIASMIGANGGVVKETDDGKNIDGVQGVWSLPFADMELGDGVGNNSIAATSIHAINASSGAGSEHVLFRDDFMGDIEYNRMSTTLYLGSQDMEEVHRIIANNDSGNELLIHAGESNAPTAVNMMVTGATNISDALSVGDSANPNFSADTTDTNIRYGDIQLDVSGSEFNVKANSGENTTATLTVDKDKAEITAPNTSLTLNNAGIVGTNTSKIDLQAKFGDNLSSQLRMLTTGATFSSKSQNANSSIILNNTTGLATVSATSTDGTSKMDISGKSAAIDSAGNKLSLNSDGISGTSSKDVKFMAAGDNESHLTLTGDTAEIGSGDQKVEVNGPSRFVRFAGKDSDGTLSGAVGVQDGQAFMHSGLGTGATDGGAKVYLTGNESEGTIYMQANKYGFDHKFQVGSTNGISSQVLDGDTIRASNRVMVNGGKGYAAIRTNDPEVGRTSIISTDGKINLTAEGIQEAGKINLTANAIQGTGGSVNLTTTNKGATLALSQGTDKEGVFNLLAKNPSGSEIASVYSKYSSEFKDNGLYNKANIIHNVGGTTRFYQEGKGVPDLWSNGSEGANKGIVIGHSGLIQLPSQHTGNYNNNTPEDSSSGLIGVVRADRFISNVKYQDPLKTAGKGYDTKSRDYDDYQINPAYTSVMHDIKLTTRGGARLSDILPDFINKGIYVIDNTYKETSDGWDKYKVGTDGVVSGGPAECNVGDWDCATTPWLGFVPAPQCPPGYVKVITINPIRWRMSEAYTIAMKPDNALNVIEQFKAYYVTNTDPLTSHFELGDKVAIPDSPESDHTHMVAKGTPLTFQTNTWLNTTIAAVYGDNTGGTSEIKSGTFMGWHAIMGFLYHGSQYKEWLEEVTSPSTFAEKYANKIVWNIFPVFNEEMTAVANVYCYFERRTKDGMEWEPNLVDTTYDQMTQYRFGNENKGGTPYEQRLNDPTLGYTDPW